MSGISRARVGRVYLTVGEDMLLTWRRNTRASPELWPAPADGHWGHRSDLLP
jgi:hypothetical protein